MYVLVFQPFFYIIRIRSSQVYHVFKCKTYPGEKRYSSRFVRKIFIEEYRHSRDHRIFERHQARIFFSSHKLVFKIFGRELFGILLLKNYIAPKMILNNAAVYPFPGYGLAAEKFFNARTIFAYNVDELRVSHLHTSKISGHDNGIIFTTGRKLRRIAIQKSCKFCLGKNAGNIIKNP